MTSLSTFWDGPRAELERLTGPLREVEGPASAFLALEGTYRGEVVRLTWLGRVTSGEARGSTLHLSMSVGDRPIRTYVWARRRSTVFGPTVTTGDEQFDDRYVAPDRPPGVVSRAFDGDVRAMIERRWDGKDTSLEVAHGLVDVIAGSSTPGPKGRRTPPTGEELAALLDDLLLVTDRLRRSYDDTRGAIAAEKGKAAADAWEEQAVADLADRNTKGRLLAAAIVIGFLMIAGLITWFFVA